MSVTHDVRIHYKAIKGDRTVEPGTEDSVMLTTWLEIDDEHVVAKTSDAELSYSLMGAAWGGFLLLELHEPSDELRQRFAEADVVDEVSSPHGTARPAPSDLWLHVRSVEFVHDGEFAVP